MKKQKPSKSLKKYRLELVGLVARSNEIFEKQLSYISVGAIAVSMAFVKDITGDVATTNHKALLIVGWGLLVLTLLVNLCSHIWAKNKHNRTISEIDAGKYSRSSAVRRLKYIDWVNFATVVTLVLGIISIVLFMTLNL
ncbi:hypothetical protein [Sunxiuqinia dokdonensis]|uniref:DUF202 domain-containing protein n=1 Tax=Sunxiuqinia dokdonensis TaxID=1409788 RepID=A0A0L8VES6_9BACT|nr:hypothetical protein [Sunxiuqinia dokdonensis]KOH46969.1 hypothetical protein NC99_02080 [Sunxiuqinia dokdonensis]